MSSDHYQTLEIDRSASAADIKKAYRRLAHRYHPDKTGGDEEKFKQVNEAYQVLSDDSKRRQYDQFGQTFNQSGGSGFEDINLNDIFSQFFGGRANHSQSGRPPRRRGQDIMIDLTIDFIDSAKETSHNVTHNIYQTCDICHGNGAKPGTKIKDCPTCHGRGQVSTTRQTMLGLFTQNSVCPTCRGDGSQIETPCDKCRGHGRRKKDRALTITVPAGIADGQTIRLSGQGEVAERGSLAGDLYANIHVKPHPILKRDGDHVLSYVKISFADAALGTAIKTTTLTGSRAVNIPAGTQPNSEIRLSNQGFPNLNTGRSGDHLITVSVEVPKKLSRRQKELLESLRQT